MRYRFSFNDGSSFETESFPNENEFDFIDFTSKQYRPKTITRVHDGVIVYEKLNQEPK